MAKTNWTNQTIWTGDNLDIMRGMNSDSVDLIYFDPPFNSNANYAAPIGSAAAGAEFKDTWGLNDIKKAWHAQIKEENESLFQYLSAVKGLHSKSMTAYLIYMYIRIVEMHRILKTSGSIYLHCDPTASHYLKIIMDCIFGNDNLCNEIIWAYRTGGVSKKRWARKHDTILFYQKSRTYKHIPQQERIFYEKPFFGAKIDKMGRHYADVYMRDVWDDIKPLINVDKERTGYPTQKPLALLRRIIKASSNQDDIVFDPFCGCATTCIAAELEGRHWIGIDISPKAGDLIKTRMQKEVGIFFKGNIRTDVLERTDLGDLLPYKKHKASLYEKQSGLCAGCKEHFPSRNLEIDHKIPRSKGGTDHLNNLQLLCGSCNRIKGNRDMDYLISRLAQDSIISLD